MGGGYLFKSKILGGRLYEPRVRVWGWAFIRAMGAYVQDFGKYIGVFL